LTSAVWHNDVDAVMSPRVADNSIHYIIRIIKNVIAWTLHDHYISAEARFDKNQVKAV
jgi:hypothetical protein